MVPTPMKPPVSRSFAPSTRFALKAVVSPAAAVVKNSRRLLIRAALFRVWSNFDCTPRSVSSEKIADLHFPLAGSIVHRERNPYPAAPLDAKEISRVMRHGFSRGIDYVDVEHAGRCRRVYGEADFGKASKRRVFRDRGLHALHRRRQKRVHGRLIGIQR